MQAPQEFPTVRLKASYFQNHHLAELCVMHQDPQVMATLGGLRSKAVTRRFLAEKMHHWQRYGFGYWMFHRPCNGDFVGRAGIQHSEIGGKAEIEIGYSVCRAFWGQGFATEMGGAMLKIGFETLGLADLICFTLANNGASESVMKKLGFSYEGVIKHQAEAHVLYRLIRVQYNQQRRALK